MGQARKLVNVNDVLQLVSQGEGQQGDGPVRRGKVTGGGGAPLYAMQEREPTQAAFALVYHFVLLEVDGNHLQATAISSEGEVLDEFERTAE